MEEKEVASRCGELLDTIADLSVKFGEFMSLVRDARRDINPIRRDLSSIETSLEMLQYDSAKLDYTDEVRDLVLRSIKVCNLNITDLCALVSRLLLKEIINPSPWQSSDAITLSRMSKTLEGHRFLLQEAADIIDILIKRKPSESDEVPTGSNVIRKPSSPSLSAPHLERRRRSAAALVDKFRQQVALCEEGYSSKVHLSSAGQISNPSTQRGDRTTEIVEAGDLDCAGRQSLESGMLDSHPSMKASSVLGPSPPYALSAPKQSISEWIAAAMSGGWTNESIAFYEDVDTASDSEVEFDDIDAEIEQAMLALDDDQKLYSHTDKKAVKAAARRRARLSEASQFALDESLCSAVAGTPCSSLISHVKLKEPKIDISYLFNKKSVGSFATIKSLSHDGADCNNWLIERSLLRIEVENAERHRVMALLLSYGQKISCSDFYHVMKREVKSTTRLFLQYGADIEVLCSIAEGPEKFTPLSFATRCLSIDLVKLLLLYSAEVDVPTSIPVTSALQGVFLRSPWGATEYEIADLLLSHGAEVNPKNVISTPLDTAIARSDITMVKLLLKHQADPNAIRLGADSILTNALHKSLRPERAQMIDLLLDHGADIECGIWNKPLYLAAYFGFSTTVAQLLDRGASINANGGSKGSALHIAVWNGQLRAVKVLLERGADVEGVLDDLGPPKLNPMRARRMGSDTIARLLLEHGWREEVANVNQ